MQFIALESKVRIGASDSKQREILLFEEHEQRHAAVKLANTAADDLRTVFLLLEEVGSSLVIRILKAQFLPECS